MKTELEDIGKNNKKLVIKGGNYSIANTIKEELLQQDSIEFAGVKKEHPQKDKFIIVVRGEDIEKSIHKSIENGKEKFEAIKSEVQEKWSK